MMNRRTFLIGVASSLLAPAVVRAQRGQRVPRVGVLSAGSAAESSELAREPFAQGLRALGWVPGVTVIIENRYAEGNPEGLSAAAAELVRLKVNVVVARGSQATRAAQLATRSIPIVMSATSDPVGEGFVASLARPGGNTTGLAFSAQQGLDGKRLELLKETVSGLAQVGLLSNRNADSTSYKARLQAAKTSALALGLDIRVFEVATVRDIPEAFKALAQAGVGAVLVLTDPFLLEPNRGQVVALALKHRLPAIYPWQFYVAAGGLLSYAASITGIHRHSATFVDKILKGAKPADLPIEQPTQFELAVNLKTAKALGIRIPQSILVRADKVIE